MNFRIRRFNRNTCIKSIKIIYKSRGMFTCLKQLPPLRWWYRNQPAYQFVAILKYNTKPIKE